MSFTETGWGHFDVTILWPDGPPDGVWVAERLVDGQLEGGQLAAHNLLNLHRQILGEQGLRAADDAPGKITRDI